MRSKGFQVIIGIHFFVLWLHGEVSAQALQARSVPSKPGRVVRPLSDSKLWIKFRDDLKVRAENGNVTSRAGANLATVQGLQQRFQLSFAPSVNLPQETLDFVQARAAQMSGIAQPDIAGGMIVSGPAATIQDAANALLALDELEWVEFLMPNSEPQQACSDIPPTTGNYFEQGYQSYHGLNPGLNMTCAWRYAGRGQGIRIGDVEYAYRSLHEDRCTVQGQTLTCGSGSFADHEVQSWASPSP